MTLSIEELDQLLNKTLEYLKSQNVQIISFAPKDCYYPKVWRDKINFKNINAIKCPDYSIGSLIDDIQDLKNILIGKYEPYPLALDKLGAILSTTGALLDEHTNISSEKNHTNSLSLCELQTIFIIIINFLKKWRTKEISFNEDDYYFKVRHKDINFDDEKFVDCPPFIIKSLTADIIHLKQILTDKRTINGEALQKLGAILTAIGELFDYSDQNNKMINLTTRH